MPDLAVRPVMVEEQQPRLTDDEIDPVRYLLMAWQRRWAILAVTLICGAGAFVAGRLSPPLYEATTKLLASPPKMGGPNDAAPVSFATLRQLFESQSLADVVVREFKLDAAPLRLTPLRFIAEALTLEPVRETNIVNLKVRLADRDLPPKVANRLAELSIGLAQRVRQEDTVRSRDEMKAEVDQARARFDSAEQRLTTFKQEAQIDALRADTEAQLKERGELLPLLVEIQAEKARLAKAEEELARHQPIGSLKRTIDSDSALMETARETAKGGSSLLGVGVRNEYVNEVYDDLDRQVAESRAWLSGLERKKLELVDARKINSPQLASLSLLYKREAELARLEAEYDLAKNLYVDGLSRYEKIRLQVMGISPQLVILDPAIPVGSPVASRTRRNILLALLLGFAGSVALAVLNGILRDAVRRSGGQAARVS